MKGILGKVQKWKNGTAQWAGKDCAGGNARTLTTGETLHLGGDGDGDGDGADEPRDKGKARQLSLMWDGLPSHIKEMHDDFGPGQKRAHQTKVINKLFTKDAKSGILLMYRHIDLYIHTAILTYTYIDLYTHTCALNPL